MPPIPLPSALVGDAVPPHAAAGQSRPVATPGRTPLLHLWHLLSLDAPTVATLWTALIARAAAAPLPPASLPAMFLAVWLLYTVDRLLDTRHLPPMPSSSGSSCDPSPGLEARHLFHHRHRRRLVLALGAVSIALAVLLPHLSPAALRLHLLLGSLLLGYFLVIHTSHTSRRLPKEIAVGVFFAAAVFIPSVALRPALRPGLVPLALLFALLCSLNCIAIYAWEHPTPTARDAPHPLTRLGTTHLPLALASFLLACFALAAASPFRPLAWCMALSAALLLLLHATRSTFAPTTLRALADLALVTPVLFLLWR